MDTSASVKQEAAVYIWEQVISVESFSFFVSTRLV